MQDSLFRHINRFVGISQEEFVQILGYFDPITTEKKENLTHSGHLCDHLFFVAKGCVHAFFTDRQGVEKTIMFAIEDWWITDFLAFHHQKNTDLSIQAIEPSELWHISYANYQQLLRAHPLLEVYFRNVYEIAYGASVVRTKYVFDYSKKEIFNHFRRDFPEFVNRVPQYMVATYLGLTPEYLSKIRAEKLS
ncbi:Crp/Fnr family transcriptional regulator [Roseivirga sp. UBA1976]|uniref:Crp/Fnr family transcriptional regulator n=1 Tax=Roseivirga sp. UBA1976 TaxID=1947386 RepID=UPI00257E2520|nr:Crp/Fnr family transcriptional regulator [Roseivirga sp. UBA1976]MEC7754242.1 Crp/Fnr family transcriptional regulator [Bacteroidota bacterium]|tara:strand:- start:247 stop:822 length:576 start_codon:yes stop_codon:yes gene_type:complete